jgi:hypothetical protein
LKTNLPDHIEGNLRHAYLERLYVLDGREYPKHPLHGHYTGLYQQRAQVLLAADRKVELTEFRLRGAVFKLAA